MKKYFLAIFLYHFVHLGVSQDIGFQVQNTFKRPILKERLINAKTISDLNPDFPSSWISSYSSVQITTTVNGKILPTKSDNNILTSEQINNLKKADLSTDIIVKVQYVPKNAKEKLNNFRTIQFSYTIAPESEAQYIGGEISLQAYLKETAIDKIPETFKWSSQPTTINFIIDETGNIIDATITMSSKNEEIDQLLLDTIKNMPNWNPAEDNKGTKVKQTFVFNIGNIGC